MSLTCFAAIAPGLEEALRDELADIGVRGRTVAGGVEFKTDDRGLMLVHLHSLLAGRVTVEVGRATVKNLDALGARVREQPWKRWVWPGRPIAVKATLRGSRLRRADAVQRKVEHAVNDALRGPRLPGPRPPRDPATVLVRVVDDRAVVSMDASGELLHKRGWRRATAKAPLRENLAAAVLRLAEWDPGEPLVDPMCGAGTFPIEAATIADSRAPGAGRHFAFERWPGHDAAAWKRLVAQARAMPPLDPGNAPILGSDRDPGAIKAATANAGRAGVGRRVGFRQTALADLEPPAPAGLVVMNPPYGRRIGTKGVPAGAFFKGVGQALRERWSGWRVAVLLPAPQHLGALRLELEEAATFKNGGIQVGLYVGEVAN